MFPVAAFSQIGAKLLDFKCLAGVTWMLALFVRTLGMVVNLECNVRR